MADEDWKSFEAELKRRVAELEQSIANQNWASDEDLAQEQAGIKEEAAKLKTLRDHDRELAKYNANALDRASTSLTTVGLITPAASYLYHNSLQTTLTNGEIGVAVASCLGIAFVLHMCGKRLLSEEFLR